MKSESQSKGFRLRILIRWVLPLCLLVLLGVIRLTSPTRNSLPSSAKPRCDESCEHTKQNGTTRDEQNRLKFENGIVIQSENSITPRDREAELSATKCSFMPSYDLTVRPMWIPGYPGSGSEMLRALVKAITGLGGDEIYKGNHCSKHTATCKTHYPKFPWKDPSNFTHAFVNRTVILIRNPKAALASYFNHKWERKNQKSFHSVQAPEEEWNDWRDQESSWGDFSDFWVGLIRSWKKQSDYEIAFYLPYERLTSTETGPQLLSRLAAELHRNGVRTASEEVIPCLWYKAIKGGRAASETKRAPHKYVPSYTMQQQAFMLNALEDLRKEFRDDSELVEILSMYHEDIRTNLRIYQPVAHVGDV